MLKNIYKMLMPTKLRVFIYYNLRVHLGELYFLKLHKILKIGIYNKKVTNVGIIFIHIPKCAGTSVAHSLYGIGGIGHFRGEMLKSISPELYAESYKFSIIRNPWERLVSAFRFVKSKGTRDVPLANDKKSRLIPDNFEEFVLSWLPNKNVDELDYVFHHQYRYIFDNKGDLIVDDIYEINNLTPLIKKIESIRGEKLKLLKINSNNSNKVDYRKYYENENVFEMVRKIYMQDIILLGYKDATVDDVK